MEKNVVNFSPLRIKSYVHYYFVLFVVNIFLLDEGYKTCDKISWLSPTTYVKELSFCNNKKALNK
ncbi:DUF1240 domain-containing protein [Proteus mirabilis]|uniref:DUF1240 domain-containing protein n=1 Tax=Proteus mirabilis TaxID=584 RepID=UPI00092ED7D0|nr:DUF1240 domain-containing protein [Proteus mirabilis]MCY9776215.1 DUF1240 domain-containing protein [Proteus mirabilis]MCY9780233.1 DUF1240 domain-containing protein [Proteus mirabilis]MCY9789725.1 DUF1240 domain-containing protein [Proteus mirabilis]MDC9749260.1 DUF1240 domain-containing protein [Proteus mirabilis]MDM3806476.1 DUF1240 domain-containing protein [Proteus mirabilis]